MVSNINPESKFCPKIQESNLRLNWIDWMKTIGMGLIIYGHFFSLYNTYVYVFSVPLFFLISGFLCKRETESKLFWKKLWYNLVVPLLIICSVNYLITTGRGYFLSGNHTLPENPLLFLVKMILGLHAAVGTLWFVYTLIILKIILQYTKKSYFHLLLLLIFIALAYIANNYDVVIFGKHPFRHIWSIPDTFVAYPFFIIGHFLRKWKDEISNYTANKYTFLWIAISLIIIFLCGHNHKTVLLFICGYGDNLILFIIGGLAGSALTFFSSKLIDNIHWRWVTDISLGTTIILGFHYHFIDLCRFIFATASFLDLLLSGCILLLFVPIIRLCKSYTPIIMGKYRLKNNS